MKPRQKRFAFIVAGIAGLGIAVGLVLYALKDNVNLYFTPTQVFNKDAPVGRSFRIGGLVVANSLKREQDGLTVHFEVTDTAKTMPVVYKGILPDLFKEGKGVVAEGKLGDDGVFHAAQVLAKHDENYMPPEAKEALDEAKKAAAKAAAAAATK
ncbi:MAG: cytochrome c maturation protein CcmE [Sideroxydans sp.]|nr:cytochrome c maturation protein CcmE [Sideroxydans sp.]